MAVARISLGSMCLTIPGSVEENERLFCDRSVVLESKERQSQWVYEERNIHKAFKKAFSIGHRFNC